MIKETTKMDKMEELNCISTNVKKEVTEFKNNENGCHTIVPYGMRQMDDDYFKRPIIIATQVLNSTSTLATYYPWDLWYNDPMVLVRLKGKAYFRGVLHLRFDISASPYQYGFYRAAIIYGDTKKLNVPLCTTFSSSQNIGVDLDVTVPGSRELVLPWISQKEVCRTFAQDTSYQSIGTLNVVPFQALARADSASSGNATLVIRAWMEDFCSFGATRYNVVAQSGGDGPISSIGYSFSKAGQALSKVPIIGGVASFIGDIGETIGNIASWLGFSRPIDADIIIARKGLSTYAMIDTKYNGDSVAYGLKQNRSLDVSEFGLPGVDDMALARIFSRDSLLYNFAWSPSDARLTVLKTLEVNPMMAYLISADKWAPSSLAYGCVPFSYWRGSIVYTVRICASAFHTGMLRIYYDPAVAGTADTTWPLGAVENSILTVAPGSCTEITINWTSDKVWLPIANNGFQDVTSTSTPGSMGKLIFLVENPLFAPLSSSAVTIFVYIRGGPDFEVFGHNNNFPRYGVRAIAGPVAAMADIDEEFINAQSSLVTAPVCTRCVFGGPSVTSPEANEKIFGERVLSLRALVKRFVPLGAIIPTVDAESTINTYKEVRVIFPMYPPEISVTAGTGNGLVYKTENNVFRHFQSGYLGVKGGMRYRVTDMSSTFSGSSTAPTAVSTAKFLLFLQGYNSPTSASSLTANTTGTAAGYPHVSGSGSYLCNQQLQQEFDVQVPDQNQFLFRYSGPVSTDIDTTNYETVPYVTLVVNKQATNLTQCVFTVSCAAADDFSFIFWQGAPTVYLTTVP